MTTTTKKPKPGSTPAPAAPVAAKAPNGFDAPTVYALNGHLDFADPDD